MSNWPDARGIFQAPNNTYIWVNEEDHLRIFSSSPGGDLRQCYVNVVNLTNAIQSIAQSLNIEFAKCEKLGYCICFLVYFLSWGILKGERVG